MSVASENRWKAKLHREAAELAEGVNAALELPPGALDEGTHWIWDDALTAWEREHE